MRTRTSQSLVVAAFIVLGLAVALFMPPLLLALWDFLHGLVINLFSF